MTDLRQRLDSLNRWQRAWCVTSIIWLVIVCVFLWYYFPSEDLVKDDRARFNVTQSNAEFDRCSAMKNSAEGEKCAEGQLANYEAFQSSVDNELLLAQFWATGEAIAIWGASSASLYLVGFGIAWIRRG
jgi:hypothetical protein